MTDDMDWYCWVGTTGRVARVRAPNNHAAAERFASENRLIVGTIVRVVPATEVASWPIGVRF